MKRSGLIAVLLLAGCGAQDRPPELRIEDAWVRPAAQGRSSTAAYFTIVNSGGTDRLTSVSSSIGSASIHSMTMDGGIMRMRHLDGLDIPSGSTVELKPGGNHVMITGLPGPVSVGQEVRLGLGFERSGRRELAATVRSGPAGGMM